MEKKKQYLFALTETRNKCLSYPRRAHCIYTVFNHMFYDIINRYLQGPGLVYDHSKLQLHTLTTWGCHHINHKPITAIKSSLPSLELAEIPERNIRDSQPRHVMT